MELKNKIDWQVKNLQECGLTIVAFGKNEFKVTNADVTNFAYYWTKKEPKTFENTSKTGKKYFVLAWKFDNVSKWVSIPTFKKIMVEDWYLIALEKKFTNAELIKELDVAAKGFDDVEPFFMKNDIYIKSVAKNNRDITKLNDAIAKNNNDLIEEEKEKILEQNKEKRAVAKKEHAEKMEKLQESIKTIRKEELIKKIDSLQNLGVEKLNSKEIVEHLENEDKLSITEIESYVDLIIDREFKTRFLTATLLIYLVKGMSLIVHQKNLTVEEKNSKIYQFLGNEYINKVNRDDWAAAIIDMDENDEALDEEDKEILANVAKSKAMDEKYAPKQGEDVSNNVIKTALKDVYLIDKKVKLNDVIELLNNAGLTNQDIVKTLNYIGCDETFEDAEVYKDANELASDICKVYNRAFK